MIKTQIPGWGELAIENLILDFNGTIAKDGRVLDGVKELLEKIHDQGVTIYIVTADTNGTVMEECAKLPVEVKIFDSDTVARDKRCLCQSLGCERTASIGNGKNDIQVFPVSVFSIAVIGNEGTYTKSAMQADVLVTDICNALELLLSPNRMTATLRE